MSPTAAEGRANRTVVRPLDPPTPDDPVVSDDENSAAATGRFDPRSPAIPAQTISAVITPVLPDRATSRHRAAARMRAYGLEIDAFAARDQRSTGWWRADPPPDLVSTAWLRVVFVLLSFGALGTTLWRRFDSSTFAVTDSRWIIGLHAAAAGALIAWSFVSMRNVDALVPATRGRSRSRGWVAAWLWLLAGAAPIAGVIALDTARGLFDDAGRVDVVEAEILVAVTVGMVAMVMWLPFRHLAVHAARIGASRHVVTQWFWSTALVFGGGRLMMAFGLGDDLRADGVTDIERLVEAAVVYGLPMLMFTLAAWRATSAVDGTIKSRPRRP